MKDVSVFFRTSQSLRNRIAAGANANGQNMGEFIIYCIVRQLEKMGL